MAVREIILYGNPRLREKSQPVEELTPELRLLVADMGETMYATDGVGLAAPQVGELVRVVVIDVDQVDGRDSRSSRRNLQVFYNPEIIASSDEDELFNEGCLSFPDIRGDVYRPIRIRFRARDANFQPFERDADDLLARAMQHEIDHLDGVFFIDRMSRIKRMALTTKLAALRRRGLAQARPEAVALA